MEVPEATIGLTPDRFRHGCFGGENLRIVGHEFFDVIVEVGEDRRDDRHTRAGCESWRPGLANFFAAVVCFDSLTNGTGQFEALVRIAEADRVARVQRHDAGD